MAEKNQTDRHNKKAYHDYFIEDKYEAGIVLHGTEVKSLPWLVRSIKESLFMQIMERFILSICAYKVPYEKGKYFNKDLGLYKKASLHKREITKLWDRFLRKVMR